MGPRDPASIAAVGLTEPDGLRDTTLLANGVERGCFDDVACGAPCGPDDGLTEPHPP